VGISSSYHIAKFWGLTGAPRRAATHDSKMRTAHVSGQAIEEADDAGVEPVRPPPSAPLDIGAVITNALKAAGLMKPS
jgi:feruloyl esterase